MKKLCRYIGNHLPNGMLIEVEESEIKNHTDIIEANSFEKIITDKKKGRPKSDNPNMNWTEKRIDEWIDDKKVDVEYEPKEDTKKEVLLKLKELKEKGAIK